MITADIAREISIKNKVYISREKVAKLILNVSQKGERTVLVKNMSEEDYNYWVGKGFILSQVSHIKLSDYIVRW